MIQLNDRTVFSGFMVGLLIGAVVALFRAPRIRLRPDSQSRQRQSSNTNAQRSLLNAVTGADPIAESIAEGKKAARHRREELGLNSDE